MIYICEYSGEVSTGSLRECAAARGLPLREIKNEEKERQRITAWLLLLCGLQREYGIPGLREGEIRRGLQGKPYFTRWPDIYFNLSHCQSACACILSEQEAGIDVEHRFPYKDSLARRICHEKEWELLQSGLGTSQEKAWALQALWSLKESYMKYDGRGLSIGMKSLDFSRGLAGKIRQKTELEHINPEDAAFPAGGKRQPGFLWFLDETYSFAASYLGKEPRICRVSEKEIQKRLSQ